MSITPIKLCSFLGFMAMKFCKKCSYANVKQEFFRTGEVPLNGGTPINILGKNFGFFTPGFLKLHFK